MWQWTYYKIAPSFSDRRQAFSLHHLFKARASWKKPRDITAWQIQVLMKRFGICAAVAFQAEDLNGYADGDALYFGAVPFHLRSDTGDMSAQVDGSASRVLPISQGWIKPSCEPELLLWWWILSRRLCSQLMDGKSCFFEERHQRALKLLWEGSVTCMWIAEEGRFCSEVINWNAAFLLTHLPTYRVT